MIDYLGEHKAREVAVPRLSRIECDVLTASSRGLSVPEIARHLNMSVNAVRTALVTAIIALRTHSKLEAILIAARQGEIQP